MGTKSLRVTAPRALLAGLALAALPMASFAFVSVGVSINIAPPALPVYVQPPCPVVGYIWTPGYWAWQDGDYYWVPGTWIAPPAVGLLWTPGYWGWSSGLYVWHAGYWGPHVGFYGGVNYGYGYGGVGFEGGYWRGGAFFYNRSVANITNIHVTNVYNKTVVNNVTVNRVSFNGGEGGLNARPTPHELAAEHEHHIEFTAMQRQQEHMAFGNRELRASVNGGRPNIAATPRPGVFTGHGIVGARAAGAPYHPGAAPGPGRGPDVHAAESGGVGHGEPAHNSVMTRNDRPPSRVPEAHSAEPAGPGRGPAFSSNEPRGPQSHMSQFNQTRTGQNNAPRAPTSAPHGQEGPRPQQTPPHMQEGPRPQQTAPRTQEAPRQQNAPRPQNAPRQENHHGGPEPHGQGQPQHQGRGPQDHGRR